MFDNSLSQKKTKMIHSKSSSFLNINWRCPTLTWGSPILPSALCIFTSEFGMGSANLTQIREHVDIEFTNMVDRLSEHEIDHIVFDDIEDLGSPDAIFPNNWVTFHDDGAVVLYPMMSSKRRNERRIDLIEKLSLQGFSVTKTIDCLLYTSPSPRDLSTSRMPSSA